MATRLLCPSCQGCELDLMQYESMMVLKPSLALFTLRCPVCHSRTTTIQTIPEALLAEVREAADLVGAGMGVE